MIFFIFGMMKDFCCTIQHAKFEDRSPVRNKGKKHIPFLKIEFEITSAIGKSVLIAHFLRAK